MHSHERLLVNFIFECGSEKNIENGSIFDAIMTKTWFRPTFWTTLYVPICIFMDAFVQNTFYSIKLFKGLTTVW